MMAPDLRRLGAAVALLVAAGQAHADETFFDSAGRVSSRSHIDLGGTIHFTDGQGRNAGSASTDSGGTTHFFDSDGRNAGSVTRRK